MNPQVTEKNPNIPAEEVLTFPVYVDMKHADRTFEKHGHILGKLLRKEDGHFVKSTGAKSWLQFTEEKKTPEDAFKGWLPDNCVFYPHEEVDDHMQEIAKDNPFGLKQHGETKYTRDGRIAHWFFVTDKNIPVPNSHDPDDKVGLGIAVRNGINANVALGIDVFTFRGICSNGAVFKDQTIGSVAIYHVGTFEEMKAKFVAAIETVLAKAEALVEYYKRAVEVKTTQAIAEKIFKKIDVEAYLPSYIEVVKDKANKTREVKLTNHNATLWQTFNDLTWKMNRKLEEGKLGANLFSRHTTTLHKILIEEVKKATGKTAAAA